MLVFSVTPFKIDQNKNQNRSIDEVQNQENERRKIYKDSRQDSVQRNISYTRYPKKSQGPEEMYLSLEHQNPSKTSEKMGYFDRVTVSLHIL